MLAKGLVAEKKNLTHNEKLDHNYNNDNNNLQYLIHLLLEKLLGNNLFWKDNTQLEVEMSIQNMQYSIA